MATDRPSGLTERVEKAVLGSVADSEGVQRKGRRYLIEGRVTVAWADERRFRAVVKGSGRLHQVTYEGAWKCSCPRTVALCSHLVACQLIWYPA